MKYADTHECPFKNLNLNKISLVPRFISCFSEMELLELMETSGIRKMNQEQSELTDQFVDAFMSTHREVGLKARLSFDASLKANEASHG